MPDAAWYPDPADPTRARWWDGAAWTEHTHDPAPAAPLSQTTQTEAYVPMQRSAIAETRVATPPTIDTSIRPGGPFTLAIVVMTLLPLVEAFVPVLLANDDQLLVRGGLALVVIAVSIGLAFWDRNALDSHGYTRSSLPQPAFAIIPALYLVKRVMKVGAASILFVVIWIGIQAGAYAFEADDVLGLAGGSLPVGTAPTNTTGYALDAPYTPVDRAFVLTVAGMEAKVAHDTATSDPVTCLPLSSTDAGATTTCDVSLPAGAGVRETIEVQDAAAAEPWIVVSTAPLG